MARDAPLKCFHGIGGVLLASTNQDDVLAAGPVVRPAASPGRVATGIVSILEVDVIDLVGGVVEVLLDPQRVASLQEDAIHRKHHTGEAGRSR